LKKVELKDVPGTDEVRQLRESDSDIYIRKVEKKGGELQNTVIQTYPDVSQFWKSKPRNS